LDAAEVGGAVVAAAEAAAEARGAEGAPEEEAIERRPGVAATAAEEAHEPAAHDLEAVGEEEGAPVRALDLVVVADFAAELPAAREVAEELAAQGAAVSAAAKEVELAAEIDRQRCHLVAMSLETDQAESGIVQAALVVRAALGIVPLASAELGVWEIVRAALADRVVSETDRAELEASADQVVLPIDLASIDRELELAIDPASTTGLALETDPVSVEPWERASGPELEQALRIDRAEVTVLSWATALGIEATDSAIEVTLPTTGAIVLKIAEIVLKTVRRTAVIVSRTAGTDWRIAATDLKTVVIG
jgi:hypothetical protein